jgi:peroxiredoxin Q/BCP
VTIGEMYIASCLTSHAFAFIITFPYVKVSVDPVEKNASFCSQFGLDFYMLSDVGGRISKTYGSALAVPGFGTFSNRQTYIIDPKGNLRWVFTDVESRVPRHSAEVLEKLNELTTTA